MLIVVAYYLGLLPAIVFVVLAAFALDYWWTDPIGSLWVTRAADVYVLLFFLLASAAIIAVSMPHASAPQPRSNSRHRHRA